MAWGKGYAENQRARQTAGFRRGEGNRENARSLRRYREGIRRKDNAKQEAAASQGARASIFYIGEKPSLMNGLAAVRGRYSRRPSRAIRRTRFAKAEPSRLSQKRNLDAPSRDGKWGVGFRAMSRSGSTSGEDKRFISSTAPPTMMQFKENVAQWR